MNSEPSFSASGIDDSQKSKLTLEDAMFIFNQTEKLLNDSVEASEMISSKMNLLVTVLSGVLLALCGYIISKLGPDLKFDSLFFSGCVGILYLYILFFYSIKNIQPHDYLTLGTSSPNLFHPSFFDAAVLNKDRILLYYLNEIKNNSYKTEINQELNEKRWKRFSLICWALCFLPIVLTACYCFTQ